MIIHCVADCAWEKYNLENTLYFLKMVYFLHIIQRPKKLVVLRFLECCPPRVQWMRASSALRQNQTSFLSSEPSSCGSTGHPSRPAARCQVNSLTFMGVRVKSHKNKKS